MTGGDPMNDLDLDWSYLKPLVGSENFQRDHWLEDDRQSHVSGFQQHGEASEKNRLKLLLLLWQPQWAC